MATHLKQYSFQALSLYYSGNFSSLLNAVKWLLYLEIHQVVSNVFTPIVAILQKYILIQFKLTEAVRPLLAGFRFFFFFKWTNLCINYFK